MIYTETDRIHMYAYEISEWLKVNMWNLQLRKGEKEAN